MQHANHDTGPMNFNKLYYKCLLYWHCLIRKLGKKPKIRPIKRILVATEHPLGDSVMMGPMIKALQAEFPEAKVDILTRPGWGAFVEYLNCVDLAYEFKLRDGRFLKSFFKENKNKWDMAVVPFAANLINLLYALNIPQIRAFADPKKRHLHRIDEIIPFPDKNLHLSRIMMNLSHAKVDTMAPHFKMDWIKEVDGLPDQYIIIHPGSAVLTHRWPVERYAEVANELGNQGYHIVLSGTPPEVELTEKLKALINVPVTNLGGKTTPIELLSVYKNAQLILGPDTGVMHLARALARPSVTIMGPTDNIVYGFDPKLHVNGITKTVFIPDLDCRDCNTAFQHAIKGLQNCRRKACLFDDIPCISRTTTQMVLKRCFDVLALKK